MPLGALGVAVAVRTGKPHHDLTLFSIITITTSTTTSFSELSTMSYSLPFCFM